MTERKTKICLISPTENLAKRARALITRQGMNIRVEVADLESAVSLAKRLSEQDDYLFISRRGTRDLLCKSLNIHVVNIPSEASDYIPAIQQLRNEQGLIAFFSFEEEISNELRTICYLLNLRMRHYCFSDSLSCQSAVRRAIADGAVWGLGGVVSERFCKNVWIALHPCGKLRCIYFTCVGDRDAALYRAAGECQTAGAAPDPIGTLPEYSGLYS